MYINRHLLCPGQICFASSCYGAEKLCVFEAEPQMGFLVWIPQTLGPKPFTDGAWGAPIHGDIQPPSVCSARQPALADPA